jgi:TRAP transporter 4TM/12TM fusion protein
VTTAPADKINIAVDRTLTDEDLEKLSADSEGGPASRATGWLGFLLGAGAFGLSAYALYWTQFPVNTTLYRASFLAIVLALIFLLYPLRRPEKGASPASMEEWIIGGLGVIAGVWLAQQPNIMGAGGTGLPVTIAMVLTFAAYPLAVRSRFLVRTQLFDWLLAAIALWIVIYLAENLDAVKTRATRPLAEELVLGGALIVLTLEATRRTIGWILPAIAVVFLLYCYLGPIVPEPFDHRGFNMNRIIGQNYLTLEGIYATPMDVAATFIILFTIYGAVLERGGAGRFFIDWAFTLFGKKPSPSAPGRAVVASGFLLGTVSGSGVATTVTVASIAWPMLKRSGYPPHIAGGMLSAAGIGATLSPPTLGAAAFIIAEYLDVEYLQILIYATIPTFLYYLSCWLMTEADSRRLGIAATKTSEQSLWAITLREGYHFLSLAAIAVFLVLGYTSFMAVFWSVAIGFALSMIRPESRLVTLPAFGAGCATVALLMVAGPAQLFGQDMRISIAVFMGIAIAMAVSGLQHLAAKGTGREADPAATRMIAALTDGARSTLGIAATCACAGILVSVVNLTGLGLTLSGMMVAASEGAKGAISLFGQVIEYDGVRLATIAMAALAMWVLGLAVPVTASYIVAAVMLVPALVKVGIPAPAAHLFMFYYAVLADVSPPTALAPFAASAITGGKPFPTMIQAWKYTLPAFLVPFMFCLTPEGMYLLMLTPEAKPPASFGDWIGILGVTLTSSLALVGLCIATTGYALAQATRLERLLASIGGILLLTADVRYDVAGFALLAGALAVHWLRVKRSAAAVA